MSKARTHLRLLVPALVALVFLAFTAAAQADYEQVGLFGQSGSGEQLLSSTGAAVNYTGAGGVEAGSVYVSSPSRISRYNAKGEIKEVWGNETIASGPDLPNQVSSLKVNATSGSYELEATTASGLANSEKDSKVLTNVWTEVGVPHVGDLASNSEYLPGSSGTGNITAGSKTITSVHFSFESDWEVGLTVRGRGIPANTTITASSRQSEALTLSQAATETGTGVSLRAGTVITAVGANTIELSVPPFAGYYELNERRSVLSSEITAPIPYNASAAELQEALVALPAFGPGDVSVTGTPGNYELTFEGSYAGSSVPLSSTESTLAGGIPLSSVAIETIAGASKSGFQRCKPDNGDVCASQEKAARGVSAEGFSGLQGVAVDQTTGYVYVVNHGDTTVREHNLIEVFSADGSQVIARFGAAGSETETFDESPAKLHPTDPVNRRIAVDNSGKVYLTDITNHGEYRVMCFKPESPGDYAHYSYCGRSQDITVSTSGNYLSQLTLDDLGHIYVGNEQFIQELSLAEPEGSPLCTFSPSGQASATTVNPLTGEFFYFNNSPADKKIHRLKPCDPAVGKFEEAQAPVKTSPQIGKLLGLALNPTLSWGPNRPPGVLYGADERIHNVTPTSTGLGYIFASAEVHSPTVLSESASNTRTASVVLHAGINPNGFGTRYVFQYLTAAQFEANAPGERFAGSIEAPAGGGEIGGGSIGEPAVSISGLTPDTAYRFRVIATSECNGGGGEPCTSEGEALPFATYPLFPPGLPDHRVYEMVSPAQKHGGEVTPAEPRVGSCFECKPNGASLLGAFPMQSSPDGEALAYEGQPFTPFEGAISYDSYVARRTSSGWQSTAQIPGLPTGVHQEAFDSSLDHGLQRVGSAGGYFALHSSTEPDARTPLLNEVPPNRTDGFNIFSISYGGRSADFSRIFLAANDTLTKETPFAPEPPDPGASKNDLYEWREGRLSVVNVAPGNATVMAGAAFASLSPDNHAVSKEGSKVFFKDEAGHLYVRENGETTRQINDPGHFLSATPDGSEVLLDDGCLYSLESESCTDLTEGKGGFKGLVGQSTDLSHLYFVDSAVLAENEGAGLDPAGNPQFAEASKSNLYAWNEGTTSFVAQLVTQAPGGITDAGGWAASPAARTAEASPNGRFLAFASVASLTGYDNVGLCQKTGDGTKISALCKEAFLYDSATEELTCASCNPTGEAPLGNTTLRRFEGTPEALPQPRYLTDEGRLYFDSEDSLSSRDTNEGVEDVYEFTPQGAGAQGTCQREAGCIFLISAGTEPVDSNLIAIDETGKNVFFDTRDKLALKDRDELLDVYDAREGGGIAAESEISRAECQGENCQTPVSPPNDPTPGSSTFEGAGNVKEAPVAKKHAKKKHKHAKKHKKAKKHSRTAKRNHGGAK